MLGVSNGIQQWLNDLVRETIKNAGITKDEFTNELFDEHVNTLQLLLSDITVLKELPVAKRVELITEAINTYLREEGFNDGQTQDDEESK